MGVRSEHVEGLGEPRALTDCWSSAVPLLCGGADPALLLDRGGRILRASRPFGGVEPSTLEKVPLVELVAEEQRELLESALRDVVSNGRDHRVDVRVPSRSGDARWYAMNASPVRVGGRTAGVFVTTTDFTKQHEETLRLRRSERLMVDTQGVAHIGTWEWDPREKYAYWSPELYAIYGLDPTTHAPSYEDYLTRVHPDDRERVIRATEGVFRDLKKYSHDERVFRPNGEQRYLHTWAEAVLDGEGKLSHLIGVCQDITDRKVAEQALVESEALFRAVFDRAAIGIAVLDCRSSGVQSNGALRNMLGYSRDELAAVGIEGIGHPDDRSRDRVDLQRLMAGEIDKHSIEKRFVRKDGSAMWGQLVVSLARNDEAQPLFAIAMLEDIDARRTAEETREQTIRALTEAVRAREVFLAIASHELRTPLTPLKLSLRVLDRQTRAAGQTPSEEVTNAIRQLDRLEALVEKLLDASRLATGQLVLTRETFDLAALAREVAARFGLDAERASCTLSVSAAREIPVLADRVRIEQVLSNLIANAIKFGAGHPVEIVVDAEDSRARIEVTDHGIGIAPEDQKQIFVRFSRAVSEMEYGGLGLGLSISREIVEAHGGRLTVRSAKGQGATFVVELPAGP